MHENNGKIAENFIGIYPVSKTLRFELKPVGKTQEYIEKHGILDEDLKRAGDYKSVKKIIDAYHKYFIDEALNGIQLDGLKNYYELYEKKRDNNEEKEFQKIQMSLRKQIVKRFSEHPQYKYLFKKELIKNVLPEFTKDNAEEQTLVKSFQEFTTYFEGFHQNRKNMYSDEEKSTAIAYRVVHQNLPKYIDNMRIFSMILNTDIRSDLTELFNNLKTKMDITIVEEYFAIDGFNKVVNQKGIDVYNTILGAFSTDDNTKIKGLNEYINLYNQKNKAKLPKLKPLFKQILSDRDKISFIPEQFDSDTEVLEAVDMFYNRLLQFVIENEGQITISKLLTNFSAYDLNKIYVKNDTTISAISNDLFDDWSYISKAVRENYDSENVDKNKRAAAYEEKKEKALSKIKMYSIEELNFFVKKYSCNECHIEGYFERRILEILDKMRYAYESCKILHDKGLINNISLCQDRQAISELKDFLDSIKEVQWLLKPLMIGQEQADKEEAFYTELLRIWEELEPITLLYNKVRNYVTKKPYTLEKVKLNFYKSTLLDGWDKNKEKDNLGIILLKDGQYYLGIMNRRNNKIADDAPLAKTDNVYRKMEYKLLTKVSANLPRIFLKDKYNPSEEMLEKYEKGTHLKGENFCIDDCRELIDFFKKGIKQYEDWGQFDFKFSDTESYDDISAFYKEVEHQGYKITFRDIDETYIDSLVNEGKLYLFQIYNKDFSPYSKGTKNLHTLYWEMLFSQQNLQNIVYKLNGNAEIFYRKASINQKDVVVHKADLPIKNKDPQNSKKESMFDYDIIKDKRFTCDKYQFHVPITMNFKALGENHFNRKVNRLIHDAENMHIIGIDRGERNLIYLCMIDMKGNIVKQISLNEIISYDKNKLEHKRNYHQLLKTREDENKSARQSWQTIHTIKELKEGYLSQVIHVITDLMVEYNAIVVLEDLNFGFKQGRQKFERQVYQKFEKMLIDKLNYLVDKSKGMDEDGGLLHAYQLTDEFKSFKQLGKQSGFLYYIPAWNTSKLDPTTGFVNLFYTKYESVEKSKEFINNFTSILYNQEREYFEFLFDYSAFTSKAEGSRLKWTVCSKGERVETYRNPKKNNEWDTQKIDLTFELKKLFNDYSISLLDGDLREQMGKIDKADFYKKFMKLFALIVQMRNSDEREDKLISPVLNKYGAFFETGKNERMPLDADANGAYNIARKGLWIIEKIKNTDVEQLDKVKLTISNKEWLQYAQEHIL